MREASWWAWRAPSIVANLAAVSKADSQAPAGATLSGARFSKSGEESRQAQLQRILAMSPLARMASALALGRRHRALEARRAPATGGVP